MRKATGFCGICGNYNINGTYYRITITRVDTAGEKGAYVRKERTIGGWNICDRHMRALKNMMEVVTHRRDHDAGRANQRNA